MNIYVKSISSLLLLVPVAILSGCGLSTVPATSPAKLTGQTMSLMQGSVFGGSQPIGGAVIQLYAAGNTGYGSAFPYGSATSLLGQNIVQTASDGTGSFSLQGTFTCPASNPEVYIVATGGNPGVSAGNNPNLALMAALGPCTGITRSTHILINEMTTVASVWALSPFMTGIANVGTSATNSVGLTNAFATVNKLVNIATGLPGGPALPSGATLPVAKLNTLADALAACVNSMGGTAGDMTTCGKLFAAATVGGVAPADTITAAMNIAQHPALGTTALFGLVNSQSPFQTTLGAAPTDWNLIVTYSAGALSAPQGLAVDPSGNLWVANKGNNSVTKVDALGVSATDSSGFLSGNSGYTVGSLNLPSAIAIDLNGNAWVANGGNSTVTQIASSGMTGTAYNGGGLNQPTGLAVDANNNVWVSNAGNSSVTSISSTGVLTNFTGGGITAPTAIVINPQ